MCVCVCVCVCVCTGEVSCVSPVDVSMCVNVRADDV